MGEIEERNLNLLKHAFLVGVITDEGITLI